MKLDANVMKDAIMQLIKDYKFNPVQVMDMVKLGIKTAVKKDGIVEDRKAVLQVKIEADGGIKIFREYTVVADDEIEEEDRDLTVAQAQEFTDKPEIWQKIYTDITPEEIIFTRIGAQAAAQTIKQQIKALEKERFYDKFQDKQGELLKAKVLRAVGDTVILDIDGTSVVLLPEGQIRGKMYGTGEEIFVLLRKIDKDINGVLLDITQASTDFIESLLQKIIPELQEGRVYIDKIVRIPGKRTKVVVGSNEDNIDPVGVFVGQKGSRIITILTLLDGEKMDFIEFDGDNDAKFVADALKPARITSVEIDGGKAYVTLPEDQKSLAIGKWASNIRLAGELTGYQIELK